MDGPEEAHADIIKHLLKHVSASAVSPWHLNRHGPIRGPILGASLSFFSCPAALRAAPRADSPSAAATGGGAVTFTVPCQLSEHKSRSFFLFFSPPSLLP